MPTSCATRATKVLKYLHRTVPTTIPRSSLQALETLPSSVLSGLHIAPDWDKVTKDEALVNWLKKNPIPPPRREVAGALFNGTLVFARIIFVRANQPDFSVSLADEQVAVDYATLAVVPIQRYASQYGPNSVSVSKTIFPFIATLTGDSFTQGDLEGWVDQVAQTARASQVTNPCVVVLHDRSRPATPTYTNHSDAYHLMTSHGTPYCYCLVFGQNLSVADNNHTIGSKTTDKVYAHILSHEIAEMVVDPLGDVSNPEVCDACAGNCNISLFDLFDQDGVFIGGTADTASATGFSFFINPIVRPDVYDGSTQCVIKGRSIQNACIYPPPFVDDAIYSTYWDATNGWASDWFGVPGGGAANPGSPVTAIARNPNHLDLFVTGTDGRIYSTAWDAASSWLGGWFPIPDRVTSEGSVVTAVARNPDHLDLFITDQNGSIASTYWDAATGWASGWFDVPGGGAANPGSPVTAIARNPDHLDLFVTGTDGRIYSTAWDAASSWLGGWFPIPDRMTSLGSVVTAVARNPNHLDLFITDQNGSIASTYWDAATGWASGWFDVPGGAAYGGSPVTAIARNPDHLDLFVTGMDGGINSTAWDAASGWLSGWFPVADRLAPLGSLVTAVARNPNHLDIFFTDQAGSIASTFWDAATGWASSSFDVRGGAANPGSPVTAVARNPNQLDLFVTG
jgi:hypothetical protein